MGRQVVCGAGGYDPVYEIADIGALVRASPGLCRVLEEDSALGEAIAPARRMKALKECLSRSVTVPAGRWWLSVGEPSCESIGLLVLDGLLIRRVGVSGRFGAELLGVGDLLRPWQDLDSPTLTVVSGWNVVHPARMAVLDEHVARRLAHYPEVTSSLTGRALQRSRSLAVIMAIAHQARVDLRLHMLFWHLAGRWGKVRSDRVALPLRLTHGVLADLIAARRTTVTKALSVLAANDLVHAVNEGWDLFGRAPGQLLELEHVAEPRVPMLAERDDGRGSSRPPGA
jgi:hypothetical protein